MDWTYLRKRSELICFSGFAFAGIFTSLPIGRVQDFGSFYESGAAVSRGEDPYGVYPLTNHVSTNWFTGFNQNLNPPTLLPLFQALSALPPQAAYLLWWSVSLMCFGGLLLCLRRWNPGQLDRMGMLFLCSIGGVSDTLHLGQIYLPLALLSCAAWTMIRDGRSDLLAGVLIGILAAIKPNFLVWPAILFLAGGRRPAAAAGATFLLANFAAALFYGIDVYREWLALLAADGARLSFPTNGSLIGFFARLGWAAPGYVAAAMLLIASAFWAWVTRPDLLRASSVGLVVSLLASPIAWAHYAILLVPMLVIRWKERDDVVVVIALLLSLPLGAVASTGADMLLVRISLGSLYFWTSLMLLCLAMRISAPRLVSSAPQAVRDSDRVLSGWRDMPDVRGIAAAASGR